MAQNALSQVVSIITGSSAGAPSAYPFVQNTDVVNAVSSTAQAVATGGVITTAGVSIARVAPTGAVTGCILQAGTVNGQVVAVVNESASADSVTFAAAATSNVATGTGTSIAGATGQMFVWDSATQLWYTV